MGLLRKTLSASSSFGRFVPDRTFKRSRLMVVVRVQGRVDLIYFPRPESAEALSQTSKDKLVAMVNMETNESKKRDFLDRRFVDPCRAETVCLLVMIRMHLFPQQTARR